MEQRKVQQHSPGICNRLYDFFMKCLAVHALKSVTLGRSEQPALSQTPIPDTAPSGMGASHESDQLMPLESEDLGTKGLSAPISINSSTSHIEENTDSTLSLGKKPEEETTLPSTAAAQPKAPKKVVSINDRVEEIDTTRKKKLKKKKSTEKSGSFDLDMEEPKPLKPILKVGSDLGEKSNSFADRASEG